MSEKNLETPARGGTIEEYWRLGGTLNRDGFEKAVEVLSKHTDGEQYRVIHKSTLAQVKNMARFSKVPMTPDQEFVYVVLREMTNETGESFSRQPEKPGIMPPWALNDQQLLAEVIRLTDRVNLDPFMSKYPNIFENKVAVHQT